MWQESMTPNHLGAHRAAFALGVILSAACARPAADGAVKPVPTGLDSAATVRWVAAERRACRGVFETLVDEGLATQATQRESAGTVRYFQRVTGVRCTSGT
jgi:hypothetical protein